MIELGWEEWLVILAVIMFAIKLGFESIRRSLFGKDQPHIHLNDPSNGSDQVSSGSSSNSRSIENMDVSVQPRVHHTGDDGDQTTINITNIEIHDSVINKSEIGTDENRD